MSKLDRQEVDNAVNQAAKEIGTRFDFRGVGASITWSGEHAVDIRANSEERAKAVLDVFKDKLVKRGVSLKTLDPGDPKLSGKEYRMGVALKEGITQDNAKKISKIIRDEGPKGVRAQVQGEELRVSAKKKDDLQAVIALLKGKEFDFALQFVNYRVTGRRSRRHHEQLRQRGRPADRRRDCPATYCRPPARFPSRGASAAVPPGEAAGRPLSARCCAEEAGEARSGTG